MGEELGAEHGSDWASITDGSNSRTASAIANLLFIGLLLHGIGEIHYAAEPELRAPTRNLSAGAGTPLQNGNNCTRNHSHLHVIFQRYDTNPVILIPARGESIHDGGDVK